MTIQPTSSALSPAALTPRVIALIIDGIILFIAGVFIVGVLIGDATIVGTVVRGFLFAALGFLYYGYSWTAWRATPGQRLMGLMTVNAADGAALTWNQAMMRWAYLFGPSVASNLFSAQTGSALAIVGLVVLGYYIYLLYTTAQDPKKQGFHDKQAASLVIVKTAA